MEENNTQKKFCVNCMTQMNMDENFCPQCGFDNMSYVASTHHLKPNTILAGKYVVGKVMGEGGFGITYVGWDINLGLKIAIKEYYPVGFVNRENSTGTTSLANSTVMPLMGDKKDFFVHGLERYIKEAQNLAKFRNMQGVVSVSDFFSENGTAYIIMNFIEGLSIKKYLEASTVMDPNTVFSIMEPVLKSLSYIHSLGIIHRDISPDNLILTPEGQVILIDFGAARDFANDEKSLSVLLKPGYAPVEQYQTKGKQGPWTDVYGVCATMYKMLTGKTPPEALDRFETESLVMPSKLGVNLDQQREMTILKGLAVSAKERIQNMDELYKYLYNGQLSQSQLNSIMPSNQAQVNSDNNNDLPIEETYVKNELLLALKIVFCFISVFAGAIVSYIIYQ